LTAIAILDPILDRIADSIDDSDQLTLIVSGFQHRI
jgi:hypothetical protein